MECECHGEPMYWVKDARYKAGGFWRCVVNHREKKRRWQQSNPWFHHRVTNQDYFDLLVEQDGKCKGCGITLREYAERKGKPILFEVDHDHGCCPGRFSCGKCVNGLVCHPCNVKAGPVGVKT